MSTDTLEKIDSPEALKKLGESLKRRSEGKSVVSVCLGTGCAASGAGPVHAAFRQAVQDLGMEDRVLIQGTGCHGFCELGPVVVVHPEGVFYNGVQPEDAAEILNSTVKAGEPIERLLYGADSDKIVHEQDVPFYAKQQRIALRLNGRIDPTSIEDYIAEGGYVSLAKVLYHYTPERVIVEISASGLRGRGGGGFPTGRKWASCRKAQGDVKYVICNGDEGDPGAFMDRSIMEANPHAILEGLAIGSYAIGARDGFIYVRAEYPLAVRTLRTAIEQARQAGFLGENILGSGHCFDVRIVRGGGAFVCGESTALMASLEGRVGEPRAKHIHTVESGLWEKPTTLNNVETWANVPVIIERGPEWFASIGSEGSKGTKVFSLVGKVKNTGLVEVPMGITLREIIFDIGGGITGDKEFKAVQTGGPSGGCIPAEYLDLEVDFDRLSEVGSMMGSGGMIVMDEDSCMVDVARYFLNFLRDESCGKCTPCREGNHRMFEILDKICNGRATEDDLQLLEDIADTVKTTSLCALGKSAPNPVLSTVRYFRDEYEAHIRDKRCPAGVCKALVRYAIDSETCICCGRCARECPVECISGKRGKVPAKATDEEREAGKVGEPFVIDQNACIRCGSCYGVCPVSAVERT
ncbi:MAG: NADH-ubiquinone oxidoreductase-F iron-sulfur binding region domain-containing protein [Planctomycetota bacterium]